MTFLEAALEILRREGKPLHYKELTERAMTKKLLTFVGRTPEVTMQTQLTAAVKKAPGSPFVRVKPGIFGLLRYPELAPEEREPEARESANGEKPTEGGSRAAEDGGRGRRRRRRGGRGRGRGEEGAKAETPAAAAEKDADADADESNGPDDTDEREPAEGSLSAEARAAALAETGVLEGDDEEADSDGEDQSRMDDDDEAFPSSGQSAASAPAEGNEDNLRDDDGDDEDAEEGDDEEADENGENEGAPGAAQSTGSASGAPRPGEAREGADDPMGRRRRRRRRRRGGRADEAGFGPRPAGEGTGGLEGGAGFGPPAGESAVASPGTASGEGEPHGSEGAARDGGAGETAGGSESADAQAPRRIMTPVDAAIEILRGQAPGRGVHVRQIADAAARRRLIHGEPNEAWRVMRTALAAEPRERLRAGQRPRVRAAGSGLFALARRPPDVELERAEHVFGEARRALRERTIAALEKRVAELPASAFEALARVLLQREGFGPTTFVKRVEGTIYVEALRGRGSRPSKCLIALRPGASPAGRRAIGELRAGIRARNQDEGLLLMAGRLAEDGIAEWKQAGVPLEIADGQAMAETCVRHGVGVINTMVSIDFVDADFFTELAEG